jgi:O-antigen ligase/tetratricopeptide (TPR) repeat protein
MWIATGCLAMLGLLTYPSAAAWLSGVMLLILAGSRWLLLGSPFPRTPFALPLGLYLAGALVGMYATLHRESAEVRFFGLVAALGGHLLVLQAVTSAQSARRLATAMLLLVLLATPVTFVLAAPSEGVTRLPGILAPTVSEWLPSLAILRSFVMELEGELIFQRFRLQSDGVGMLAAFGVGLSLGPVLAAERRRQRSLGLLAAGWFLLALVLAGNRGALLSAVLAITILGGLRYRWLPAVGLLVLAATIGAFALAGRHPFAVSEWLADPASFNQRLEIWQNALFLLSDFPLTGVGLGIGSVQAFFNEYFLPYRFAFAHSHNIALQTYLEQGILGLLGLAGVLAVGLVLGWRALTEANVPAVRSPAISAAGGSLALALSGLTEVGALTTIGMLLLFGSLGLLLAVRDLQVGAHQSSLVARRPFRAKWIGVPVLGALAMFGLILLVLPLWRPRAGSQPFGGVSIPAGLARMYLNLGSLEHARASSDNSPADGLRERHRSVAIDFLQRARDLDPDNPSIYRGLAAVLAGSDQPAARGLLNRAEELARPDDSRFLFQLGRLYREAGDVERAVSAWSRADRRIGALNGAGPDIQLVVWGSSLVAAEQWEDAVVVNWAAVQAAPTDAEPYQALARALREARGDEAALATMQGLAQIYVDVPWPYSEVWKLYKVMGRAEDARNWTQQAGAVFESSQWRSLRERALAEGAFSISDVPAWMDSHRR